MHSDKDCPCHSGKSFENCCNPILKDHSFADTPEKLMRSRYTAFVVQNRDHLLRTWAEPHRPNTIEIDDSTVWINLEITEADPPLMDQNIGHVSYIASFLKDGVLHIMKERSNFILMNGLWFYKDGDPTVVKSKVAMKAKCPCGSGKKYKRCCYR